MGLFFIGLFTVRFFVEFIKESQGGFETAIPMFSTGQWLSIPFILLGFILLAFSFRKQKVYPLHIYFSMYKKCENHVKVMFINMCRSCIEMV